MPKVSVLMPVYNAGEYLHDAIQSVLGQSFHDLELIVINDGSTDGSKQVIFSFADDRIRYVENDRNLGLIATLNKGLGLCRGEYIVRMDSDDICHPRRIERQVRFMDRHPRIGLCGTWAAVIDERSRLTGRIVTQIDPAMIDVALLFSVPLVHPSVCMRAGVMQGMQYDEVPLAEDYDLWCRLAERMAMANIPSALLRYRWHLTNVSKEKQRIQVENTARIIRRQLLGLGIEADDEMLRVHRLSFTLHGLDGPQRTRVSRDDMQACEEWFATLIEANDRAGRYDRDALRAFLWGRWIVMARAGHYKKLIPSFATLHPRVVRLLAGQLCLLAKK